MPEPIKGEPQSTVDRLAVREAMNRVAETLKLDPRVTPGIALAALQNVIGHLLATQFDAHDRAVLTQTIADNVPLYAQVYLDRERRIRL